MSDRAVRRTTRVRSRRVLVATGVAVVALLVVAVLPAAASASSRRSRDSDVVVVAAGLDNPRGLAFLGNGKLAVAEAGHAGDLCLGPGECLGLNGQVSVINTHGGRRKILASGLASLGGPFGTFGLGGLTVQDGDLFAIMGLNPQAFGNPSDDCQGQADFDDCVATVGAVQGEAGTLNRLNSLHKNRGWSQVASVGSFDFDYAAANPDPGNPEYAPGDANPFGVIGDGSDGFYVIDAASNTLDHVSADGQVAVLAFIPDPPAHDPIYDAAPTCAARTSDGDIYIGTESNSLWRWNGAQLTEVLSGGQIGQVVGCVADGDGNLYLANLSSKIGGSFPNFNEVAFDGSIVKVAPDLSTSYVATGLNYPTGLTLGPDGDLYVALNGLCPSDLSLLNDQNSTPGGCPASGEVVRLALDHSGHHGHRHHHGYGHGEECQDTDD